MYCRTLCGRFYLEPERVLPGINKGSSKGSRLHLFFFLLQGKYNYAMFVALVFCLMISHQEDPTL